MSDRRAGVRRLGWTGGSGPPIPSGEVSMQYLLLIYGEEGALESISQADRHAVYEEYDRFAHDLQERQAMVGGDELAPTSSATTLRVRDGQTLTTDGPFAETKEQLGGYVTIQTA